jgi:hypothetical protein
LALSPELVTGGKIRIEYSHLVVAALVLKCKVFKAGPVVRPFFFGPALFTPIVPPTPKTDESRDSPARRGVQEFVRPLSVLEYSSRKTA